MNSCIKDIIDCDLSVTDVSEVNVVFDIDFQNLIILAQ